MQTDQNADRKFMQAAIEEAKRALSKGEVPVGAVITYGDRTIGRGYNLVETLADATAHAEMQAITSASATIGGKYLKDCTLYVTLEPCIMCAGACSWSQIGRIVYGASDPKRGFTNAGKEILHPKTVVSAGVMEEECAGLLDEFFRKLRS